MWEFFGGKFKPFKSLKFKHPLPKIDWTEKYFDIVLICFDTWWVDLTAENAFRHCAFTPNFCVPKSMLEIALYHYMAFIYCHTEWMDASTFVGDQNGPCASKLTW